MALYNNPLFMTSSRLHAFDETWAPGNSPILPGIYRCSCGVETVHCDGDQLPDHEHGAVWRLVVAAEERPLVSLPMGSKVAAAPRRAAVA